jgi:TP901 family phage tail tape measure protein
MATDKTLSFGVEFISKGLDKIDRDLVNTFKRVGELEQAASVVFKGNDTALSKAQRGYQDLSEDIQSLSEKVKITTDRFDKFKRSKAADDKDHPAWEAFTQVLAGLNTKLAAVTGTFKGFNDQLSGTAKGANINIQNLLTALKGLGVSDTILTSLKDKLSAVNNILITTGRGTQLGKLNRDMEKYYATILKVEEASRKFKSLDLKSPEKNKAITTLDNSKDKIVSGKLNNQQTDTLLKSMDLTYKSLLETQNTLLKQQKESKSVLVSDIALLEKRRELLNKSLESQKYSASIEDLKTGQKVLKLLDAEIEKRKKLLTLTPTSLSTKDVNNYTKKINTATGNTGNLADLALSTKEDVNLSKNFINAKEAAKSLLAEVDRIGQSLRTTSTSTLEALKRQIESINTNLSSKTKGGEASPKVASSELSDLNKKLGLLRQINEYENKIEANANLNPGNKDLGLHSLEALRGELIATGSDINILKDKFSSLKQSFDSKSTIDVGFDNTIKKYISQIGELERLKNAKTNWAKDSSLDQAQHQIELLGQQLERVRRAKQQFDESFTTSTNFSTTIKEGSAQLQNINKKLAESSEITKHLNAQLNDLSFTKWLQNIGGRVLAYTSLYAGISQVTQALSEGISYMLEYDQAIHTLSAVLDMSSDSATKLEGRLADLGTQFGGSLKDINETALALGRAGFDKSEVVSATEIIIKMARLTGDTFQSSASALISYMEVYGDSVPNIEAMGDSLAYVANQSRLSTQDIGTLANYALAAAKSVGFTRNAVDAMAIAFSNAGVNASTIGTQVRRLSSFIGDTSKEAVNFFTSMGVSQAEFSARLKMGVNESNAAMTEFVSKLKNISDSDFARITKGMDVQALQSVTLLRNNADEFFRHLQTLNAGVKGEVDKAAYVTESYAITWEKLGNSLGIAFNKTAGTLLPTAKNAVDGTVQVLDVLNRHMGEFTSGTIENLKILGAVFASAFVVSKAIANLELLKSSWIAVQSLMVSGTFVRTTTEMVNGVEATTTAVVGLSTVLKERLAAALGVVERHPLVVLFTLVAAAAAAAYASIKDVGSETSRVTQLAVAEQKVRNTLDQIRATTDVNQRAALTEQLYKEQELVKTLREQTKVLATLADAHSNLTIAKTNVLAYQDMNKHPNDFSSTTLSAAGDNTKTAMINFASSISASIAQIIKTVPQSDTALLNKLTQFQNTVGGIQKDLTAADFNNKDNVSKLTTLLNVLIESYNKARVASGQQNIIANTPTVNAQQTVGKSADEVRGELVHTNVKGEEINNLMYAISDPIKNNFERLTNLILYMRDNGLNVHVSSGVRDPVVNQKVGGVPNSDHTKGLGADINIPNKTPVEVFELIKSNAKLMANIAQLILEKDTVHVSLATDKNPYRQGGNRILIQDDNGKYHTDTSPSAQLYTTTGANGRFNIPTSIPLVTGSSTIPADTPTQVHQSVPESTIKALTAQVEEINKAYNASDDVNDRIRATLEIIDKNINALFGDEKNLTNQLVKVMDGAGKPVADEIKTFLANFKGTTSDKLLAIENFKATLSTNKKGLSEEDQTKRTVAAGMVTDMVQNYTGPQENIDKLNSVKEQLLTLGEINNLKQDGIALDEKRVALYTNLSDALERTTQEQKEANDALDRANDTSLEARKQSEIYEERIASTMRMQAEKSELLTQLLKKREDITKEIEEFNQNGSGNLEKHNELVKKLEEANQEILATDKDIVQTTEKIAENRAKATAATAQEIIASRRINAEYQDLLETTKKYTDELERQAQLSSLGSSVGEDRAKQILATRAARENELANRADASGPSALSTGFGLNKVTYKEYAERTQANFDKYAANANTQIDTLNNQEDTLNQAAKMQSDAAALQAIQDEIDRIKIERNRITNDTIIAQNKAVADAQEAQMGMQLKSAQVGFQGLNEIAQTAFLLSGKRSKAALRASQALQVASAIVNTYMAASNAYRDAGLLPGGTFLAPIAAAGAIAVGMQQVAQIKAQTFHTGGYVYNDNRTGLRSDEVPATLQTGEYVLSRKDMAAIKEAGNSKAPQQSSSTQSEVVIVNSIDPSVIESYLTSRAGRQIINNVVKH